MARSPAMRAEAERGLQGEAVLEERRRTSRRTAVGPLHDFPSFGSFHIRAGSSPAGGGAAPHFMDSQSGEAPEEELIEPCEPSAQRLLALKVLTAVAGISMLASLGIRYTPSSSRASECGVPAWAKVVPNTNIGSFACYKRGDIVCHHLAMNGHWEDEVIRLLEPFMGPDTIFVDVGSNVGWYSFSVAKTHRVVAFEPFLANLQLQNATRCLQPALARNIELHRHGLSNVSQVCDLYQVPDVNHGDTHSVCDEGARRFFETHKKYKYEKLGRSELSRLDDVASPSLFAADKVLKVDIEGHELEMFMGAPRFLSRAHGSPPKAVFVEVNQLGPKRQLLDNLLRATGYVLRGAPDTDNLLYVLGPPPRQSQPPGNHKQPAQAHQKHSPIA